MNFYDRKTAPRRHSTWFVYCLVDDREPEHVRYVGLTNHPRARLAAHLSRAPHEGWHKSNWVRSVVASGGNVLIGILESGLSFEAAKVQEVEVIAQHRPLGRLTNLTDGGDGVSGTKQSAETRAKKSAALKGRKRPEEHCRRISEGLRGKVHSQEVRDNMRAAHLRRYQDPGQRQRQADGTRRRFENEAERDRYREITKARFADPAERARASARGIEVHRDKGVRRKIVATRCRRGPQSNNKTGFKGIRHDKRRGVYYAGIMADGVRMSFGPFLTPEEAARVYDEHAVRVFGPSAYTNFK